jgi:hypothetical protein
LTPRQIATVGGSSLRIPDVRGHADLELLERLTSTIPRLGAPTGWGVRFGRELNATESRSHCGPTGLPILEGKHIGRFSVTIAPTLRIERGTALRLLPDGRFDAPRLGYRDVSGVANSRSLIASLVPAGVVTTHTVFCLRTPLPLEHQHFLCGLFNSFVLNAIVRLLMGSHITTGLIEDLPVPPWRGDNRDRLIALLAAELADRPGDGKMEAALEAHVACRYSLDAAHFAHLLEGFPLVPADQRARAEASLRMMRKPCGSSIDPPQQGNEKQGNDGEACPQESPLARTREAADDGQQPEHRQRDERQQTGTQHPLGVDSPEHPKREPDGDESGDGP